MTLDSLKTHKKLLLFVGCWKIGNPPVPATRRFVMVRVGCCWGETNASIDSLCFEAGVGIKHAHANTYIRIALLIYISSHRPSTTVCREVAGDLQWLSARVDGVDAVCVGAAMLDLCTICWQRFAYKPDSVLQHNVYISVM